LAGAAFGQDEYARQQLEEASQKQQAIRERFPTAFGTYKDVRGIGDTPEFISETLGELTPDIVAMLTGAGALGAVGRRAAVKGVERAAAETAAKRQLDEAAAAAYKERLTERAAPLIAKSGQQAQGAGLYGVSLGLNAPDTFESIYEKTGSLAPGIALAFGAAQSALDAIVPAQILRQFSPAVKARAAAELAQQSSVVPQSIKVGIAKELAKTGAGEAGTESVQELLGILAEKTAGAPGEVFSQENIDRMINAGIKGLIGGTAFGAPGAVVKARRDAAAAAPEIPPTEETPPAPPVAEVPPGPAPITPPVPGGTTFAGAAPTSVAPEEELPRTETALPTPTEPGAAPSADVLAAAEEVSAPAVPEPTVSIKGTPPAVTAWPTSMLQAQLESETSKPEVVQNAQLIEALTAELLRRGADKGEPRARPPAAVTPAAPEPAAIAEAPAPQQPVVERPTAAPAGESVPVPSGPAPVEAPTGVAAPEPSPVVRSAEPATPPVLGTEPQPTAVAEAAPEPAPEPTAAPAPTPVPEGVSRETLIDDMRQIIAGKQALMVKGSRAGMRAPFANSPARKKFDALDEQLAQKKQQWRDLTGEELDVNLLGFNPDGTLAPTAPPLPPAPAVTAEPAPVAPKFTPQQMLERAEEAQRKADEAAASPAEPAPTTEKVAPTAEKVAPPTEKKTSKPTPEVSESQAPAPAVSEEPKKRGRPKKVLTEEETQAKADREAEKAKKKAEREAKQKAEREEQEKLKGLVIETTYTDKSGKRVTERMTPEEVDEALKAQEKAAAVFGENERGGYDAVINDSVQPRDREILLGLTGGKRELNDQAAAAKAYFSKTRYATNALYDLAFDLANALRATSGTYRKGFGEGTVESQRFAGTGGKQAVLAAQWVRDSNLTNKTKSLFDKYLSQHKLEAAKSEAALAEFTARQEQQRAYEEAAKQTPKAGLVAGLQATEAELKDLQAKAERQDKAAAERRAKAKKEIQAKLGGEAAYKKAMGEAFAADELVGLDYDLDAADLQADRDMVLRVDAASQFARPLHPVVRQALMQGDLKQALRFLAAESSDLTRDMAKLHEKIAGTTDVVVVNGLTDASGKPVPGYFDPKINTVFLDSVTGMNSHVLFHELGHAATSHIIANPSHPVTRQLTQIFNDVKGSLDTAYGTTSLDEFVAEAWANEEFKGKLNAINPRGEKITAWDRFVNAVRNLFRALMGRPTVSVETAFDRTDKAIRAILSNAPETRGAELLNAATINPRGQFVKETLNSIGRGAASLPGVNTPRGQDLISKIHEFFKNTLGGTGKSILMSTLPLDAFTDAIEPELPGAKRINEIVNLKHGDEGIRNQKIEPSVQFAESWASKAPPGVEDRFNSVVYESTLEKIDPTRPRQYYEDKFAKAPAVDLYAALKTYDKLKAELDAVDKAAPGARKLYAIMRNTYMELNNEILREIGARIDQTVADPEARQKIKNEIFQKLADRGQIDPYFPLTRNGKYWLRFEARDARGQPNVYVQAYETERERTQEMEVLKKLASQGEVSNIQAFSNLSELSYRNTPSSSFVNGVLKVIEVNRPKNKDDADNFNAAMEGVLRMYLATLPETSFAQAFQKRKERLGFSMDSIRAFREKTYSMSRQLSNMKYAAKLYAESDKLREYVRKMGEGEGSPDNRVAREYFDALQERINFAVSPTVSRWAQLATTFGFNYLLGFNVSSALVNMTQVPLIVMPHLGGPYGYAQANKAIAEATKIYMGSGFSRTVEMMGAGGEKVKTKAMPSLDNYDFDAKDTPAHIKKYKTLADVAAKMGQLNRSQLYDILDVDGQKSPVATLNAVGGFAFHHAERMNRQVTLMAAYNLELERLKKAEPSLSQQDRETLAAQRAVSIAETTNGGVSAGSAPPITQNAVGRVLFMFKRYGVSMYYMLFKMTREVMQNQDPAVRKAAFKQLAGIYGTTALISGVQGMPLFGVLAMIYNMFKEDDEENFASVVRGYTGESVYKGLINDLTGLSIAERTGLSDLLFRESPFSSGSTSLAESMAQIMGGPIYGIASRIQRGVGLINEGEMARGIESIAPVALANLFKSIRFATEGANTLRGDPIVGDIGPWNVAAQFLGFTPAEYTRQLEQNSMLKGIEKSVTQDRVKILRQMFIADRVGDNDGYDQSYAKLQDLYDKHPGLGDMQETIRRSMAQHERTTQEMYHGIILNKKLKDELLGYVDDWKPAE
jgi:hypothetical protein